LRQDSATTLDEIRALETISFRGWPALESELHDGWLLRAANGYTGRANSINPLYGSSLSLDEKIAWCDAWYTARSIAPVYRLNDAMQPPDLDAQLAARGYRRFNESWVMVADIGEALTPQPPLPHVAQGDVPTTFSPQRDGGEGEPELAGKTTSKSLSSVARQQLDNSTPARRRVGEGFRVRADTTTGSPTCAA
jgi:hypothetical protein